jgi:hypothetical protein
MNRTRNKTWWASTKERALFAAAILVVLLPLDCFASVKVEPSVVLTQETIEIAPEGFQFYEYELVAGSELVFTLDLFRWRREPLRLWLVDTINSERFRAGQPFDYIAQGTGSVEQAGRISYLAPATGRYYMVLDNSRSRRAKQLSVYAYARMPTLNDSEDRVQRLYRSYYDELDSLFEMGDIELEVRRCGRVNAYAVGPKIVICRELHETLSDNAVPGVELFVFLHEASHSLISRWGHQSINVNQIMVDRLAATMFRMIDDELALSIAAWFSDSTSLPYGLSQQAAYVMSDARARRIASWLIAEERFDRKWSRRIVVPRMRTPALESLLDDEFLSERSREYIYRELSGRETLGHVTL